MCLSDKVNEKTLFVVENFSFEQPKTKVCARFLKDLELNTKNVLVLTNGKEDGVLRVTNNLPKVSVMASKDVNVLSLLSAQAIVASRDALSDLEKILNK